MKKGNKLDH